ncbi:MAG: CsgG/HfaB family protein [Ignavibacteriaceae bacterium]
MKNLFYTIIILLSLVFCSCSYISGVFSKKPDVLIKKDFNGEGIAVLTFSRYGHSLPSDIGRTAADKLTDALFLVNKFNVIDRSKINDAQAEVDITNTEFLSGDKIQQIGLKLKASYLILGRIDLLSEKEYLSIEAKQELGISFRIISVADTEVLGVANYHRDIDDNIPEEMDYMISQIVIEINKQRE